VSDAEGYQAIAEVEEGAARKRQQRTLGQRLRWPLMIGGPLVVLAIVVFFVLTGGKFETTDDAYVQSARAAISPSVAGRVIEIDVGENQTVKKGQVLFRLDPADFQVAVAQAEAALAAARFETQGSRAVYDQRNADLAAAQETVAYTQREAARQRTWPPPASPPRPRPTKPPTPPSRPVARSRSSASRSPRPWPTSAAAPTSPPTTAQGHAGQGRPRPRQAGPGYATIVAPADGVVTKVEQLQVGNRVAASQTLFWSWSRASPGSRPTSRKTSWPTCGSASRRRSRSTPMTAAEGPCRQLQPRHRLQLRPAAARERHRQLGQGRPAPARAPGPGRERAAPQRRPQRQGQGRRPLGQTPPRTRA
jgi:membrane fusion protein (multidrug efflux system)